MDRNGGNQVDSEQPIGADRSIDLAIEQGDATPIIQPAKRRKWPWVLLVAVIIVLAAATSYCLIALQSKKTVSDPLAAATKFTSPQELVNKAEPELRGTVMNADGANGIGAVTSDGVGIYSPPIYRVSGAKFEGLPLKSTGIGYMGDSVTAQVNYDALVHFFNENKFQKIATKSNTDGRVAADVSARYVSYAEYQSGEILCAIRHVDASATLAGKHISSLGCATKKSYQEATDALQPFYTAYTDDYDSHSDKLAFGFINKGKGLDEYEYAVIYQRDANQFKNDTSEENIDNSFTALYLKEPNDSEWLYFMGVDGNVADLSCATYKDDVLKKSFNGFNCYDDTVGKESTVKI